MSEWVYFLHAPRDDFAATMSADEAATWERHFEWLGGLLADGRLVLAGASGSKVNTGLAILEAVDEDAAQAIVSHDPAANVGLRAATFAPLRSGCSTDGPSSQRA